MIQYRKTRDGSWAAFGPAAEVHPGAVTVTKRDGSRKVETVERVTKPFVVDDVPHVYGFLAPRSTAGMTPGARGRRAWRPCGYPGCSSAYCDECDGEGG